VYGPEESREADSFYERQKGEQGRMPINVTKFREAERRFKKRVPDMEDVLDLRAASKHPRAKQICQLEKDDSWLWGVEGKEGFFFIPTALSEEQQKYWITEAMSNYMTPPNLTNLDAHYHIPEKGLWSYFENNETLHITRKLHPGDSVQKKALPMEQTLDRAGIRSLIRRIRWVTLGYQYDWTSKEYDFSRSPVPFPSNLAAYSSSLTQSAGLGPSRPEAGIVNFYQPGDTLTGHVDRSEPNMQVPLVSMSLGAPCIFLVGGRGRDEEVLPVLLRGGDVVIMAGEARYFYHGVPRILPLGCGRMEDKDPKVQLALELLGDARININIRQVNT
jgi:alkylated DNA repair protein alkB family protein 1